MIHWLAGQAARDFTPTDMKALDGINIEESEEFKTTKYFCKTNFDMEKIKQEESFYVDLPKIYSFASEREKEIMLNRNFMRVNEEIERMVNEQLGKGLDCCLYEVHTLLERVYYFHKHSISIAIS